MFGNGALAWLQNASDEIEKGRFACSVCTQDSDARIHAVES